MQIGSASFYAAPLSPYQAGKTLSAERTTSNASQPLDAATSADSAEDQTSLRDSQRTNADQPSPAAEAAKLRQEELQLAELISRDREVRTHEQAHAAVGGSYAGAPTYTFKTGPDGRRYAVGGEVSIDTSPVPNDPEATLRKMEVVIRAALAPAEPSAQDRRVAAQASVQAAEARVELAQQRREEQVAAAEERAALRAEREAEEEAEADKKAADSAAPQQGLPEPPRLELYLRLAQLQSPEPTVDLSV